MATNLVSAITQVLTSDVVARVASNFGVDGAQVERAFQAGVPALLAALTSVVSKPAGASALGKAVAQQEPGVLSSLAGMLGSAGQATIIENGASTLTSLLGSTTMMALTSAISRYTGVGSGISKSLMGLLGPVVLGVLGQQQRMSGLDSAGLADLLISQKDNIARALPAGFAEFLSGTGILDRIVAKPARVAPVSVRPQRASSHLAWILPVIAILAAGGLAWYLLRTPSTTVATAPPAKVETPAAKVETPAKAPSRVAFVVTADQVKDWIAKPVYSSDNKKIGEIVEIRRDPDNRVTDVFIDTGSFLGIGATRYRVASDQIQEVKPESLTLTLKETDVKTGLQPAEKQ